MKIQHKVLWITGHCLGNNWSDNVMWLTQTNNCLVIFVGSRDGWNSSQNDKCQKSFAFKKKCFALNLLTDVSASGGRFVIWVTGNSTSWALSCCCLYFPLPLGNSWFKFLRRGPGLWQNLTWKDVRHWINGPFLRCPVTWPRDAKHGHLLLPLQCGLWVGQVLTDMSRSSEQTWKVTWIFILILSLKVKLGTWPEF